jgi:hypothetical protein
VRLGKSKRLGDVSHVTERGNGTSATGVKGRN